jgi:hypothetical protein
LCPSKVSSPRSTLGSLTLLYLTPVAVLTHTLCPLCPSKRSLSTQGPASAPLALCSCTACTWIPFAILSLVSSPLPDRVGHPLAVLASQPTARHSPRPAAPPRRCRSTLLAAARATPPASCSPLWHKFASLSRSHLARRSRRSIPRCCSPTRPAAPAPPRRCRSTSCRCLSHASCVVLPPLSQHPFASPSRTH